MKVFMMTAAFLLCQVLIVYAISVNWQSRNQKNGLNILATSPTKLIEQGRYEEALQLENMSNEAIKGSEMPITILCLYKAVPENLEECFSEYHDLIIKRSAAITSTGLQ